MRFYASHLGSGLWGLYDGGVMSWLATDLSKNEAKQQAADRNVIFDQWGQRDEKHRRQVSPPIQVESATWTAAGKLDYWVRDGSVWWAVSAGPMVTTSGSKLLLFVGPVHPISNLR